MAEIGHMTEEVVSFIMAPVFIMFICIEPRAIDKLEVC
jgi:hypothetical protein